MRWLDDNKVTPVQEETIQAIARNPHSQSNYTTIRTLDVHPLNDENGSIYLRVSEDKMLAEAVLFFEGEITEEAIYKVLKENEVTRGVLRHTLQKVLMWFKSFRNTTFITHITINTVK